MTNNLTVALGAVMPLVIYILTGVLLRRIRLADEAFLDKLNQFNYRVFFTLLMFSSVYRMRDSNGMRASFVWLIIVAVLIVALLSFLIVPCLVRDNTKRGVIVQAMFRSNLLLLALPLTRNVFGEGRTDSAVMTVTITVPLYTVLAVSALEYFRGNHVSPLRLLKAVFSNPQIVATILAALILLAGVELPEMLVSPVSTMGNVATPLALITLGASLRLSAFGKNIKYLIPCIGIKMCIFPVIATCAAWRLQFRPEEIFAAFCLFATPNAAASYPVAKSLGGDGELAAQFVVLSTMLSGIVLVFGIALLREWQLI